MARQKLILDRYRVIEEVGIGGYGTVQRAFDTRLKRDVAIKLIELSEADVARARLVAMEEKLKDEDLIWDDADDASSASDVAALPEAGAEWEYADSHGDVRDALDEAADAARSGASSCRVADIVKAEPLPWEDDFDLPEYPDDPAFLDTRAEASIAHDASGAQRDSRLSAGGVGSCGSDGGEEGAEVPGEATPAVATGATVLPHPALRKHDPRFGVSRGCAGKAGASRREDGPSDSDSSSADLEADIAADDLFDHIPGLEEARTAAHLNDANIVTVYDCEVHGTTAYVIMEYVEGKTLSRIMRELGDDISLDVIAAVFTAVSHALEVAHDNDVLHLDIKPENVIVNKKGVVKVTDFGLATLMDSSGYATTGGGTIGYMPLEQMRRRKLDVRTDEWALASLTYEMLSGENPFRADTLEEGEDLIETSELVLPSLCWDALPREADDVVFDALDPDPNERYESVADFAAALTPLLGNARAGKRALAAAVNEEDAVEEEPPAPREPLPPLIDRIGPKGASILARVISVAGAAMVGAVSLVNARLQGASALGLAADCPVAFWAILAVVVALAAIKPALGVAAAYVLFFAMLLINQAFLPAVVLLLGAGAWWWFVGRHRDGAAAAALMQPLFGSVGLGALSPVTAGVVLDVREAAATGAFAALSAVMFASLGSSSLVSWDIVANALTPASAAVSGGHITGTFVSVVTSPGAWVVAVSWVLASTLYSLFCVKGTRSFDIAGAVCAAALLVIGLFAASAAQALVGAGAVDLSALSVLPWLPDPISIVGVLAAGVVGVVVAVMFVPDRIRLAEGEW